MKYRYREDRPADDRLWKIPRPKGMDKYILEQCQTHAYLIFSTRLGRCVCTACNKEMSTEGLMLSHSADCSTTTWCPSCGRKVVPKDVRYGRKKLKDMGHITWMRAYGRVTYIEVDEFVIDYTTPHPAVLVAAAEQIRLTKDSQVRMDWAEGYWVPGHWQKIKAIGLRAQPQAYFAGMSNWHDHLWREHVEVGTDLRYANPDPERFDDKHWDEYKLIDRLIRYLAEFLKYPAIELLEKAGFKKLVMNRASGQRSQHMNIRGKELRKILRLSGGDVRKLRKLDPSIWFLEDIRKVRKVVPDASLEDVQELASIIGCGLSPRSEDLVRAHADIRKVVLRLLEERRTMGNHVMLRDYADYIEAMEELGVRLGKRGVYPRNFSRAHDEALAAVEAIRERERERKDREHEQSLTHNFRKSQRMITGMDAPFVLGKYMIRPAETPAELRAESRDLNHCVRTYVDSVARGTTSILFIRETKKPDTPLFTLELSAKGNVVQCRGDHNCGYPEEVAEFIKAWKAWWDKMMKKRNVA